MDLSNWQQSELESLARVYIKHKQLRKASAVRAEIAQRLQEMDETDSGLQQVLAELDSSNVVSLIDRVSMFAARFKESA